MIVYCITLLTEETQVCLVSAVRSVMQYTNDGMYVVRSRKVCLVSAVKSVMQYTNDGMYVVEEKGVYSLCCEECDAIYQ